MSGDPPPVRPDRNARESAALRENLLRRKAQSRERADVAHAVNDVVTFWFLAPGDPGYGAMRDVWFRRDAAFDAEIAARFLTQVDAAAGGALDGWAATPEGALALIVLLDQFPRNLFRGQARAFATDAQARAIAGRAIAAGFDQALPPVQRMFVYLPYEHSETLADQHRSVALFEALPETPWRAGVVDYARRHRAAIERFGRFPARNAALGRESTPDEAAVLAVNPAGF
jgi:uncharacterized protein (DUF924 family)